VLRRRRFTFLAALLAVALFPNTATARRAVSTPFSPVYEQTHDFHQIGCWGEDDFHTREWGGTLNGSFTATEQLCDDAGGIGLQADLEAIGTLSDLTITSPQGETHHAVLVGSTTKKRQIINHYEVCFVPSYALANNSGGTPLSGGMWTIALSGDLTTVPYQDYLSWHGGFSVTAEMADVRFQQNYCPLSQQNLV
jgi:hypothetical protein